MGAPLEKRVALASLNRFLDDWISPRSPRQDVRGKGLDRGGEMTHPTRRTFGSPDRGVQPVSLSDQSDLAHLRADRGHEVAAAASPRSRPTGAGGGSEV